MSYRYGREKEELANLTSSAEFKRWVEQGKISVPAYSAKEQLPSIISSLKSQISNLAKEDTISNYYEIATGQKATPEIISKFAQYSSDPAMLQAAINKEAVLAPAQGKFNDSITQTITDKLGRAPTTAELGYFGKQMESGNLDAYGLQEFLQGTTEYQTKASDTARAKLATELGGVDDAYLAKINKSLESKYASQGRSGSSAFGSSLIGAGKDLATERTGYLAGLGYQDFQQGQGNLTAAYNNRLAQMYANQQSGAALGSESRNRYYSQQDYDRNLAAQERLARLSQPKQASFLQTMLPYAVDSATKLYAAKLGNPKG